MQENVIIKVEKDSIAEELGIEVGDILLDINEQPVNDVFDYRYLIQDEYIEIGIRKADGEEWLLEIEKDEYEDLGIIFERGLMDKAKSCSNKCIFCFIDQLPKGMRDTLYFKDDDSRLSFLQGNYVTLTNMKKEDLDRIIFYHLSPINVSVQTTDPELRKYMLKNPRAVNIMENIKRLADANIEMNFQIVLCKNINDGKYLDKSIEELSQFIPHAISLSVVPFGKTKFRDKLEKIELFDKEDCRKVIKQVEGWQKKLKEKFGTCFVHISDEFYLKGELELPDGENYEGYTQLENGVGMITLMKEEFEDAFEKAEGDDIKRHFSVATGALAHDFIKGLCNKIKEKYINTEIEVYLIKNKFFGEDITVSGLMTGQDIISQLKGKNLGNALFLPENCLRAEETTLLDDIDIADIERELEVEVKISKCSGDSFLKQFINMEEN